MGSASVIALSRLVSSSSPPTRAFCTFKRLIRRRRALRILDLNRLQRLKGIEDLFVAVLGIDSDQDRVTVASGDTDTGPVRTSKSKYCQAARSGDSRVGFAEQVRR